MNKLKVTIARLAFKWFIVFSWRKHKKTFAQIASQDTVINNHGASVRVYTPPTHKPHPVVLYFHGGGFMMGSVAAYDAVCRDFCLTTNCMVVSVDYRLGPEHVFPAAAEDCLQALQWLHEHIHQLGGNNAKVYLYGDSAGGNLAAVVAQQARELYPHFIQGQILVYPVLDDFNANRVSYQQCEKSKSLSSGLMRWFWRQYIDGSIIDGSQAFQHALATPAQTDDLSAMPSSLIITVEEDPLRDEGIEYAQRLAEAGNSVKHVHLEDYAHGCIGTQGPNAAHRKAMPIINDWLQAQIR